MVFSLGSINADLVIYSPEFPQSGETLVGDSFFINQGGKGANQAVAAFKAGAPTTFIGRVGKDYFGDFVVSEIKKYGVNTKVIVDETATTGTALINVDGQGKNKIAIVKGANEKVGEEELKLFQESAKEGDILLLQGEIPVVTIILAAKIALEKRVITIFDPAPVNADLKQVLPYVDYVTPNEIEIKKLSGSENLKEGLEVLKQMGAKKIIIKQGDRGIHYIDSYQEFTLPSYLVKAIDTTGAGDSFNGALAASFSLGLPLMDSLKFAIAGAAISVTRKGAAISSPTQQEIQKLLEENIEKSTN
ncbi:MAG: Ribokinase [candidate division WS2 bacterium]|nr:Ribokinase [Candidatus Psychracetigena formicireducens]MBT9150080.1 Ribokinase [Candidatus Psychracetigena formicireducens]